MPCNVGWPYATILWKSNLYDLQAEYGYTMDHKIGCKFVWNWRTAHPYLPMKVPFHKSNLYYCCGDAMPKKQGHVSKSSAETEY